MKRHFLFFLLTIGSFTQAVAQQYEYGPEVPVKRGMDTELRKMRFGVFFAPNVSWMKPTANKSDDRLYTVSSEGSKGGYSWGLMMDYYFAENYGIATGFQLNSTGGKILATQNLQVTQPSGAGVVRSAYFDYRTQFLEIPFNLKLRSDAVGKSGVRFFGQIGLSLGFNISKKASYEVTYSDTSNASPTGFADKTVSGENEKLQGGLSISPVMLGMNLGAGVEYPITPKMSIYGGVFFNNGFVPDATNPREIKMDYKGKFSDGNTRLNNIAFRIGLFF
ncbi:MAG: PorT family protein [Sphingobacteriales bacterium]|nr:MAG: PorT family protein [Sphingobacteriales bacterium]